MEEWRTLKKKNINFKSSELVTFCLVVDIKKIFNISCFLYFLNLLFSTVRTKRTLRTEFMRIGDGMVKSRVHFVSDIVWTARNTLRMCAWVSRLYVACTVWLGWLCVYCVRVAKESDDVLIRRYARALRIRYCATLSTDKHRQTQTIRSAHEYSSSNNSKRSHVHSR